MLTRCCIIPILIANFMAALFRRAICGEIYAKDYNEVFTLGTGYEGAHLAAKLTIEGSAS